MSDDDLIRRGGVKDAMTKNGFGGSQMDAAIEAIPAAPLDALTLERAARVAEDENDAIWDHDTGEQIGQDGIARAIRALAPEPAHVTAARLVKIKPLVWVAHPTAPIWRCDTPLGTYKVFALEPYPSWDFDSATDAKDKTSKRANTPQAAKAAAQADYEARIRSAIVDAGE